MPAKNGTFRTGLGPGVAHSEETLKIFSDNKKSSSALIREAILNKAKGFEYPSNKEKPYYLTEKQWQVFKEAEKNSRSIDYSYFLALHWLKAKTEFRYTTFGALIRAALVECYS